MDFKNLKQKALELKDKAVKLTNDTLDKTITWIYNSSLSIKNQTEFDSFILKSANTTYKTSEWVEKEAIRRISIIYWDYGNAEFRKFLIWLPVLLAKWFSDWLSLKILDTNNTEINKEIYEQYETPSLFLYENKELKKIVQWMENINKVVKTLNLDINKTIDQL